MGLLDSIEGMVREEAGQQSAGSASAAIGSDQGKVAGGLMQALDEHPGGLAGVLDHFKNNGMEQQAEGWAASGQPATPQEMHQGLQGSGLIESVAQKAGVSPQVAEMAMATVLPMVMAHFTQNGKSAPPQSGFGGMAGQILGRLL